MNKKRRNIKKVLKDLGPVIGGATFLISFNAMIATAGRGWLSWSVSLPALLIIAFTAAARVYDVKERGIRWFMRRMGLMLTGASAAAVAIAPLLGYSMLFPSWYTVSLVWGFALSWLTTPNMPPWHKYITGEYKLKRGQKS